MVNRCIHCREITFDNKLFCSNDCKVKYFGIINDKKIKIWNTENNQSKRRSFKLSDLLNEENLKVMVKQTESRIDKKMNILKR